MPGNGIHCDGPSQDVTGHGEYQEDGLRSAEKLLAESAQTYGCEKYLSSVCHVVDLWVCILELSYHISGIRRKDTETCDEGDASSKPDSCQHGRK